MNKIKPATGLVKLFLVKTGFSGITLPPFGIYILEHRLQDQRLQKHELHHWKQYEDLGLFKFYAKYLWLSLLHGYRNNPMEIEARIAELT